MKKSTFIVFVFLLMNQWSAWGQDQYRNDPTARAALVTEKMMELIPITKEKRMELDVLNLKYAQQIQTEIIDSEKTRYQQYKAMRALNKEKEQELKSLYTKEEYALYLQKKSKLKKWARQQMQNNGFGK